jgi:uncharacterized repeat protein (TIGR01451 family)
MLSAGSPTPISGRTDDPSVTDAPVDAGVYTLSASGPGGYTGSTWDCGAADPVTNNQVTLTPGEDVTCVISQDDQPAAWSAVKSSTPGSGEVLPGSQITYAITATPTGGVPATAVTIVDDLSDVLDDATLVTGPTASTGTASVDGTTMTWDIPTLSAESTVIYTVMVNPAAFSATLENVFTGSSSTTGPADCAEPAATGSDSPCLTTHFVAGASTSRDPAGPAVPTAGSRGASFAVTGTEALGLGAVGLGLLAIGIGLVTIRRRRPLRA